MKVKVIQTGITQQCSAVCIIIHSLKKLGSQASENNPMSLSTLEQISIFVAACQTSSRSTEKFVRKIRSAEVSPFS